MAGDPAYLAPEQMSLDAVGVDRRSDVFALGVLFYEMLTGARPFPEFKAGRVHPARFSDSIPIQSLVPLLPEELREVVHCAISVTPDDRFNDGNAFLRSFLRAFEDAELVVAVPTRNSAARPSTESSAPPQKEQQPPDDPSAEILPLDWEGTEEIERYARDVRPPPPPEPVSSQALGRVEMFVSMLLKQISLAVRILWIPATAFGAIVLLGSYDGFSNAWDVRTEMNATMGTLQNVMVEGRDLVDDATDLGVGTAELYSLRDRVDRADTDAARVRASRELAMTMLREVRSLPPVEDPTVNLHRRQLELKLNRLAHHYSDYATIENDWAEASTSLGGWLAGALR